MQRLALAIGAVAILALSFFGTLSLLDSWEFQSLDAVRIEHAKSLKAALEKYRAANGAYPGSNPESNLAALKSTLVDGGYIASLPVDPYWTSGRVNKYRYRNFDGSSYGLLFHMELGPCQTGVGRAAAGPWEERQSAACPF
jgi:hypothetical protein